MRNMKIGTKLMTGFGFVILLALVLAVVGLVQLRNVQSNYGGLVDGAMTRRQAATEIGRDFGRMRRVATAVVLYVGDQAMIETLWQDYNYDRRLGSMEIAFQDYFYSLDNDRNADALAATRREAEELYYQINNAYHNTVLNIFQLARADDYYGTRDALIEAGTLAGNINDIIDGLIDVAYERSDEILAETEGLVSTAIMMMIIISVLVVLIAVVCALYIANIVGKPIREVSQVIESVSGGNLQINFKGNLSRDEVGVMTQNTYNMVNTIKGLVDDIAKFAYENKVNGDTEYRIDTSKYQGAYKELLVSLSEFADDFTDGVHMLLGAIGEVNNGNFNVKLARVMPGKRVIINQTADALMANVNAVRGELGAMIDAAANKGDLSFQIDATKYNGEWRDIMVGLNDIAKAVDVPLKVIQMSMREMEAGNFDIQAMNKIIIGAGYDPDPLNHAGAFREIIAGVDSVIEITASYIGIISQALKAVAEGDLTTTITQDFVGSYSEIKDSLNNISSSLNKTMSEINSASEQVLSGAKQISASSMDLANGASTQASSVEELNASVDLINQQTRQNADNASEANTLSQTSTDNAREGNEAMNQTLGAMMQIKDSSNNISKIIRTIQDIAFQTNLLALNAAVEAARAGEHGKGFAVVAEEVRSLAARSQEAASETTELIGTSISTVDSGSEIAQSTAETLNTIVENANKVLDIVSNISTSSQEQAEAISQVVQGLQQISQVVQANSAVSEEAAAASEELTSQAEILQQLVGFFKL